MLYYILLGIGLSMDCMTSILCLHAIDRRRNSPIHYILPLMFAVAQTVMPLFGWALGIGFKGLISRFDHWVAFALLLLTGLKMIQGSLKGEEEGASCKHIHFKSLAVLSLATSIDSVVAGMTVAFLGQPIIYAAAVIGVTTLAVTLAADLLGDRIGHLFTNTKAGVAGGAVIALLGVKILVEHLFF